MTRSQRGGEPLALDGGRLGDLRFEWSGDRYTHHWRFDSDREVGLTSLESDGDAAWPISPPLQQIHRQSFGDGREVVFGVGMAGRGHWSASFTLVPELRCWIVELACRSPAEGSELLSSYRLHGPWSRTDAGAIACQAGERLLCLEAIETSSTAELDRDQLTLRPHRTLADATNQWAFRLRA